MIETNLPATETEPEVGQPVDQKSAGGTMSSMVSFMYSAGDRVAALVFGFGSLWMLTRLSSVEVFGVWVFFQMTVATLEVARSGLLQNGLIRFLKQEPEEKHGAIYGGAWLLNTSVAVLGALILWFGGTWLESFFHYPGLARLCQIYGLTFLATTPLWQYNYLQQAHLEFRGPFFATILRNSTLFGLTACLFFGIIPVDGADVTMLQWLAWGQLVAASLGAFISWRFARRFLPASVEFSRHWAGKLFGFGKYVFGTNLSSMLYKQIDSAMLGALLLSSAPTAIYGLAIRITNFVDVPTLAMASIVFPKSAEASVTGGASAQARMYEKAVAASLACTLPALLVVGLLPELFVAIVGGAKYAETAVVLQVTVLFSLFIPFANQFGTLLDSAGYPKVNFLFTMAGMLVNVLFNYLMITHYGVIGAPLATLSTYIIMFGVMQTLLHRKFEVRLLNVFKAIPGTYALLWQLISKKLNRSVA